MMDCLKRVRATGNYIRPSRGYYRCVKFIRELQQHELRMCIESPGGAVGSLKTGNGDEIDAEGEDDEDYLPGGVHYETPGNEVQRLELHEVGRVAPRWIAGQNITNFLYDLVHNTGIKGISTMVIFGQPEPLHCITDDRIPGNKKPGFRRFFQKTIRTSA